MTDTKQDATQLLTEKEQDICQKIVAHDTDIAGQRAATLLAINDGVAHAETSEQTGLTVGQIRYLVTAFRKKRLAIFPNDVVSQAESAGETGDKVLPSDEASLEDKPVQLLAEAKKEKETKKAKKSKKDKGKKSKKDKGKDKKKKGKKSKKDKAKKAGKKKSTK